MSISRIERIAAYLAKMKTASTRQLAAAVGVNAESIGNSLKHEHVRARWGIKHLGQDPNSNARGRASTLWGIDPRKYMMLRTVEDVHFFDTLPLTTSKPKKPKAPTPKVPKARPRSMAERVALRSPSLTRWLPCSPYYQGDEQ